MGFGREREKFTWAERGVHAGVRRRRCRRRWRWRGVGRRRAAVFFGQVHQSGPDVPDEVHGGKDRRRRRRVRTDRTQEMKALRARRPGEVKTVGPREKYRRGTTTVYGVRAPDHVVLTTRCGITRYGVKLCSGPLITGARAGNSWSGRDDNARRRRCTVDNVVAGW